MPDGDRTSITVHRDTYHRLNNARKPTKRSWDGFLEALLTYWNEHECEQEATTHLSSESLDDVQRVVERVLDDKLSSGGW